MVIIVQIDSKAIGCCLAGCIDAYAIYYVNWAICTSVDGESLNIIL